MPAGEVGLDDAAWLKDWNLKNDLSKLPDRTRTNVENHYRGTLQAGDNVITNLVDILVNVVFNGFKGLAEFIAHLGESITGVVGAGVDAIGDFLADRWVDLTNTVKTVTGVIDNITKALTGGTPGEVIGAIFGPLSGLVANIQKTWDGIVRGWFGNNELVGGPEDVEVVFGNARAVTYAGITMANLANAPKNIPFWVSPNPFEEVSFPRSQLESVLTYANTTTGASNTNMTSNTWTTTTRVQFNNHTHNVSLGSSVARPLYSIPAGTLALSVIRSTADRLINQVRFLAGGDVPPTQLFVGLYEIDPTTGVQKLIYDFGNVRTEVPDGPQLYEVALEMTSDMLVDAGKLVAVGILPVGRAFNVAAIRRSPITPDPVVYPQSSTELKAGLTALPATVADSELSHVGTHRVWASIGQALTEYDVPVHLTATFDDIGSGTWVSPNFAYFSRNQNSGTGNEFRVSDGKLRHNMNTTLVGSDCQKSGICLTRTATNDQFCEATLSGIWHSSATEGNIHNRLYVRANSSGTEAVALVLDRQGGSNIRARISTVTNMFDLGVVRATATEFYPMVDDSLPGDKYRIEVVGDVYTGYRNGVAIPGCTWTDTGGVGPGGALGGAAWRRTGFGMSSASWNFAHVHSGRIDVWQGGDMTYNG